MTQNKYKPMDVKEVLALSKRAFVERCIEWIKEFNDGKPLALDDPLDCPLNQWVQYNHKKCRNQYVSTIATCPICGNPMCPDCSNHCVEQLSRVTGYYQPVSGWNEAKKQEFVDRTRHDI